MKVVTMQFCKLKAQIGEADASNKKPAIIIVVSQEEWRSQIADEAK